MANDNDVWSPYSQIDVKNIFLYREGWPQEKWLDLRYMMEEINLFEDLYSPTLDATLIVNDNFDLCDRFPILGGERVKVNFKTPGYAEEFQLEFVISKIIQRVRGSSAKGEVVEFALCTLDRYNDANKDVSMSFSGRYSDIVPQVLTLLKSTKNLDKDDSNLIQSFVSPYWSPLKICNWMAQRAVGSKFDPFVFYETIDGYNFKSMLNLYKQTSYCKFRIEFAKNQQSLDDVASSFRRVVKVEFKEASDKLRRNIEGAMGADVYMFDLSSKSIEKQQFSYVDISKAKDFAMMEKYPLYDDTATADRSKVKFLMTHNDNSHLGAYYRKMVFSNIDAYRLKIMVPGDSGLRVGQIVDLDVPSSSVGSNGVSERTTSGRWLIISLRHIVKADKYNVVLEIGKDSHQFDITKIVTGDTNGSSSNATTGYSQ